MPLELKQHRNGIWYVHGTVTVWRSGRDHPVEVRKSTKCRDEAQADGVRRQIESSVAEQNITGREPSLTFNQAARQYVKNGGEERFLEKPKSRLGWMRVDEITQQMIDDEGQRAYPDNTATRRRQFHAPVIAVLKSAGIGTAFKRPPDSKQRTIFLWPEKAVQLVDRINDSRYRNPWSPALVTFLFGQGSRVGETLAIDGRDDISLPGRYAILRDTKNGRERMVTLCNRTIAAASTIPNLGHRGPLFLRYDGRPYTDRDDHGYQLKFWTRAAAEMELDVHEYTPHIARHSWATWFYSQTKDVVRLVKEGGWESDEWRRYVKLAVPAIGNQAIQLGYDFRENAPETNFAGILRA